jgi:hypothetical protein
MTVWDTRLLGTFADLGPPVFPQRSPWIRFGNVSYPKSRCYPSSPRRSPEAPRAESIGFPWGLVKPLRNQGATVATCRYFTTKAFLVLSPCQLSKAAPQVDAASQRLRRCAQIIPATPCLGVPSGVPSEPLDFQGVLKGVVAVAKAVAALP